jgi:NAD(P)-dependent dehydrogenase (short-subunit alcohol dehydrogenase family)
MEIEGKRVLITGANRGLGRALAFAFASAGAREIIAGARKPEDIEQLKADALADGAPITPVRLDVRFEEDVAAVVALGPVDILVNNAAIAVYGGPFNAEFADIRNEIETNYLAVVRLVQAFAPAMIEQGDGMIVNIATIFAKVNLPIVGTYCATKAALLSLGQALRAHLADKGVRVITVMPSTIDTDMSRSADVPKMTKEFVATEILRIIREEPIDPPIGEEAQGIFEGLVKDPLGMEQTFAQIRE